MKRHLVVSVFFLITLFFIGIESTGSAKEKAPPYVAANFSYTPASEAARGSAGVTFAMGSVSYTANMKQHPWFADPAFGNLDQAVKDDLAEILRANGFNLRERIGSGEMTYSEKKAIDLLLETTIDVTTKKQDANTFVGPHMWKLTLQIREPVTRELLWSNNVTFQAPWDADEGGYWWRPLARNLEKQYPDLMAQIVRLLDPQEMKILKKQAQELKTKKGY